MSESIGGGLTQRELDIENTVLKLAKLLDKEYEVDNEFYGVLNDAIGRHIELIGEA